VTYPDWSEISGGHRIKGRDLPRSGKYAPNSASLGRTIVFMIMFLLAGRVLATMR